LTPNNLPKTNTINLALKSNEHGTRHRCFSNSRDEIKELAHNFFKGFKKALNLKILLDLALLQLIHAKFLAPVCKDLKPAHPTSEIGSETNIAS
jgi:hypothetical protein